MFQQINSLNALWKAVKPGGHYFCEDLQTSLLPTFGGDPESTQGDPARDTMLKMIYRLIDDLMAEGEKAEGGRHPELSSSMRSIDCMKEVCVFTKKEELAA